MDSEETDMTSKTKFLRFSPVIMVTLVFMVISLGSRVVDGQTGQSRQMRPVSVIGDLIDVGKANDERNYTRAMAGRRNYQSLSITLDLGGEQNIVGVVQDHGRWQMNYPGQYRVEVSPSMNGRWARVFEGSGTGGESKASFEAVRGRFIRITATDTGGGGADWSIAEVRAVVDPGAVLQSISDDRDRQRPDDRERPFDRDRLSQTRTGNTLRNVSFAFDRNLNTRATSGVAEYAGSAFTFDLEGEFEVSRLVQLHGQWPDDYPAEYRVEVSRDPGQARFREVFRGAGTPGRSIAQFAPVVARYVRITALRNRDNYHWLSIAELQTNRDRDVLGGDEEDNLTPREIRRINAQGVSNVSAISDGNNTTRATTNTVNYTGSWIEVELGGSVTVSRVVQIHDPDDRDFRGRYKVEVSDDSRRWRTVFQGQGERGRSVATFTPVRARWIRITAVSNHDLQHWWSIYNLKVRG
jgi:hypothetical protein